MSRTLSILASLALFAAPAAAADDTKATSIRWHGQSCFEIVSKSGVRIVLDPHAIPAFGRKVIPNVDLVLCSHHHTDHTRLEMIDNIKELQKEKRVFIGTEEKDMRQKYNEIKGEYKGVKYYNVFTFHDDVEGMKRGKNTVLVLELDGLRIVHLGDLGHRLTEQQIKKIGKVDVLMVPIGGVYTLNGIAAHDVIDQLKPTRCVLPMHYGVPGYPDLLNLNETKFLDDVDPKLIRRYATTNEFLVDADAKPPKEPLFVLLNFENKKDKGDKDK
jgi:L-ascorbate metabolism protein UlaG (beta-lactamase superfamily)